MILSLYKDSHGTTSSDSDLWRAFLAKKAKQRKHTQQLGVEVYEFSLILYSGIWINPIQVKRKKNSCHFYFVQHQHQHIAS